eukprot:gnl/Hemi2/25753_TR8657_c0_g1_i1.p1 gnl/Hemi2/25753_TR8657_c0_g1~~gnl/Hemi2/25753_TR8657_c0_g1_i1.p1  ORF type:complete len:289 (+),score=46.73 gnl/Hemi2/25753_TR8657_c0_g1_i1:121-987(+)
MMIATPAEPFAAMVAAFRDRVRALKGLTILRHTSCDKTTQLTELAQQVQIVEDLYKALRIKVAQEKACISHAEKVVAVVGLQQQRLAQIRSSLPPHLPGAAAVSSCLAAPAGNQSSAAAAAQILPTSAKRTRSQAAGAGQAGQAAQPPAKRPRTAGDGPLAPPPMAFVTVDELQSVPQYVKSRVTLEKLNSAVEEVRRILTEKYKLLASPPSRLTDVSRARYQAYKDQETKDTAGTFFFSDADVKASTVIKADASGKAILGTLKHLGRIRMVTSAGVTYWILNPSVET